MDSTLLAFPTPGRAARSAHPASAATFDDLAYWQAANYLTLGQLYLRDNPLLSAPLAPAHLKRSPAGPWRHSALTNLLYTQLNRLGRTRDAHTCIVAAPASATPALLANLWLDGTFSTRVAGSSRDGAGMLRLFRSSGAGGATPPELGGRIIGEGPETGAGLVTARRCLLAAAGAVLGAPDVVSLCLLSEDQADAAFAGSAAAPLGNRRPGRDGLVLPVIELDSGRGALGSLLAELARHGLTPLVVDEEEPCMAHAAIADVLPRLVSSAGTGGASSPAAIVFVTPPAFSLPIGADGTAVHPSPGKGGAEDNWLLLARATTDAHEREELTDWLLSCAPDALFDSAGAPTPRVRALVPPEGWRVGEGVGLRGA